MSDDFSASIEDYLVGLAASLQYAQRQLSALTVPGDGSRPSVAYQLPKLDFELKLSLEISRESSAATGASAGSGTTAGSGVAMRGRLLNAAGSRAQSAEAASTIRGTFVAVPLDGGKPPPVLTSTLTRVSPNQLAITVRLATATGEPLAGVDVHFNPDRQLAAELNLSFESASTARPLHAVVPTSEAGEAHNVVVAADELAGMRVPVIIDALGRSTTIVFTVEGEAAAGPADD